MRIALAVDGKQISQHFGHCRGFEIVDIKGKKVVERSFLESPGHRPGALPKLLGSNNVDVIISGGMGSTAQALFNENNIEVITGANGNSDDVIDSFIDGTLPRAAEICERHEFRGQGMGSGDCDH